MAAEIPTEEQWVPASYWAPKPGAPVPRRRVPTTAGCENQQGLYLVRQRAALDPGILLNWPKHRLPSSHTLNISSKEGMYWEELNCQASGRGLDG